MFNIKLINSILVTGKYREKFSFSILMSPGNRPNHENQLPKIHHTNPRKINNKPMPIKTEATRFIVQSFGQKYENKS